MQKETIKTPPHLENIAGFGDNQVSIHIVAKLSADGSKNFTPYSSGNNR